MVIAMNEELKAELLKLLEELQSNCGDNRGRDGEYLSDAVGTVIDLAKKA